MTSRIEPEIHVPPQQVVCWIVSGAAGSILRELEANQSREHFIIAKHALLAMCDGMNNIEPEQWASMVHAGTRELREQAKTAH